MDPKSKQIYEKIEHFLEERKGRDRRRDGQKASSNATTAAKANERRQKQDRRSSSH